jgi:hypothetical protein
MQPDFTVKFSIDRITQSLQIILTDATTGATNIAGNFTIHHPDWTTDNNDNFLSPDISATGGTHTLTAKTDRNGEVRQGSYSILYSVVDQDNNDYEITSKYFYFDFDERAVAITNTSDEGVPEVSFSVSTNISQTSFIKTITTFEISSIFPPDSEASAITLTKTLTDSDRTLDQVNGSSYYDGVYNPEVTLDVLYQHVAYDYLTVQFQDYDTREFTLSFDGANTAGRMQLLSQAINNPDYDRAAALISNELFNQEKALDFGTDLLSEFHEIVGAPIQYP